MSQFGQVVPLRFDMSAMVRRSVATLYSHLVTRPTGEALRLGIETQITELGALCVTVLDFSEVAVLDYSCADEVVAKLIQRYQREDRPAEAYFLARGIEDRHRQTIEAVLGRQGLAITAELADGRSALLGQANTEEQAAWEALEAVGRATPADLAGRLGSSEPETVRALESLARRRVVARVDIPRTYFALRPLLVSP
jgi:CRP-like cAMP-binding protein